MRQALLVCIWTYLVFSQPVRTAAAEPASQSEKPYQSLQQDNDDWWELYEKARSFLVKEGYREAALLFARLEATAVSSEQRRLAAELGTIARVLQDKHEALRPDERRTADELSLLYSTAFVYGFGTSAWLALQTKPGSFAGAVLPFAVLTTASVGGVAAADSYRPFERGMPQAISGGLYLGFLEGVWIVGMQHSGASRRNDGSLWNSARVATILWSSATAGAVIGGAVGSSEPHEPGNVSFVVSSGVWGGIVAGLGGAAIAPDAQRRGETAFIAAGVGQNLGLAAGLFTVPEEPVSIGRVRLTDIGGLAGGVLGSAIYLTAAGDDTDPRWGFGAGALGATAGLGLTWWLTREMEPPKTRSEPVENLMGSVHPFVMPTQGGASIGLAGTL
jgi:hypothetical protein